MSGSGQPSTDARQSASSSRSKPGNLAAMPDSYSQSDKAPMNSPCYVHSYLGSGLDGSKRKDLAASSSGYFDAQQSQDGGMEASNAAASTSGGRSPSARDTAQRADHMSAASPAESNQGRSRRQSVRHQPMHRSVQGAVEPDSDHDDYGSDGGTGSVSGSYSSVSSGGYTLSGDEDEDENRVRSLTRQLAETAVGVREMSKQLGRARVKSTINSVLVITKARDNHLIKLTREIAIWLMATPRNGRDTGLIVYVDSQLRNSKRFDAEGIKREHPEVFKPANASMSRTQSGADESRPNGVTAQKNGGNGAQGNGHTSPHSRGHDEGLLRYWTSDMCSRSPHLFDMVVTLGGDGTVLFCSWLFQRIVPPVMPFALGSLGFLTNFDFSDYKKVMNSSLDTGVRVNLRMRFTATVYRATLPTDTTTEKRRRRAIRSGKTGEIIMKGVQNCGWDSIETPLPPKHDLRGAYTEADQEEAQEIDQNREPPTEEKTTKCKKDKEVMCFSTRPVETFEVINDLVVDRGPSPYVSLLEVFGDEHHLTTAQADGLCISTPTGSTAYSLSAGGSLVHPEIPAILITPICPHTLSFRPMLLPDSMELRIAVPYNSRSTAWASFDGRGRVELKQGDHIKVTASRYPFPTVCADNQSTDWFESISRTLKWNERERQKSFVVVEEGDEDDGDRKAGKQGKKGKESRKRAQPLKNADKAEPKAWGQNVGEAEAGIGGPAQQSEANDEDDEDDDIDDDEEEKEERFDIDDTSTAATRTNSPDGQRSKSGDGSSHHGHHRHHSHSHKSRSGSNSSSTNSRLISALSPMTSSKPQNKVQGENDDNQSSTDSSSLNHKHGIVSPSGRSLLDSPDRFGLAGPPQPPKALSERHLASADFRLDDGGSATEPAKGEANEAKKEARASALSGPVEANELRDSITKMAEQEAKLDTERQDTHLYHDLKQRSSNQRVPTASGNKGESTDSRAAEGSSSRSRSRPSASSTSRGNEQQRRRRSGSNLPPGKALVVYGHDESDSDSTAEG